MSKKLEGKIALITGGSTGIGFATAEQFVAGGAYVFITGRRQAELEHAVKTIESNITGVEADASSLADLDSLYPDQERKRSPGYHLRQRRWGSFAPLDEFFRTLAHQY